MVSLVWESVAQGVHLRIYGCAGGRGVAVKLLLLVCLAIWFLIEPFSGTGLIVLAVMITLAKRLEKK